MAQSRNAGGGETVIGAKAGRSGAPSVRAAVRALRIPWLLALFGLTFLTLIRLALGAEFYLSPGAIAITAYQAITQDMAGLLVVLAALPLAWLLGARLELRLPVLLRTETGMRRAVIGLTAFTFLTAALGAWFLLHGFPLAMDEFAAWFQAEIFLHGDLLAPIERAWAGMELALQPHFVVTDSARGLWGTAYQPLNALLLAGFETIGAGMVMNAVFGAGSVFLAAALARRLWPGETAAPVLAAALLALSPQVLVTAMTPYAMTGHLFAGLLWMWLFLRDARWSHAAAMALGAAAIGLHQIHVHPFFALPFMVWLLRQGRWPLAAAYGVVYGAAILAWPNWWDLAVMAQSAGNAAPPAVTGGAAAALDAAGRMASRDFLLDLVIWPINLARFLSWQNLALVPLLVLAWRFRRDAPPALRMMAWSALSLLAIHAVVMPAQGHGWGYRYLHPVLGNLALLAVFGWLRFRQVADADRPARLGRTLAMLGAATAAVLLPLHLFQAARAVRPVEQAVRFLQSQQADVVLVDGRGIHIGLDLARNSPYLTNRPKLLEASKLTPEQLDRLCRRHEVTFADYGELARFGIAPLPESVRNRKGRHDALHDKLRAAGCPPYRQAAGKRTQPAGGP